MNSMGAFSTSGPSSAAPSVTDLDGYTLRDTLFNSYSAPEDDEFGFDPPEQKPTYPKMDQIYSPPEPNDLSLGGWPGFEREEDLKEPQQSYEMDKLITQNLPNTMTAISRYGQVTPPRTNSADSTGTAPNSASASPKSTAAPERRKRTSKAQSKESEPPAPTTSGRKRKTTRKAAANVEPVSGPEDSKRKASLEKNRLAAAKCRVNKKEKTEQLQRDSHDKAVHNAFLKDQIMHMKEEIQQMNAVLLAHANCKGCKSPNEIQKHLGHLSHDFLSNQMSSSMNQPSYGEYPAMSLDEMPPVNQQSMMANSYFGNMGSEHDPAMLNPPLPDFDRSADFEVHTPMQTD